MVKQTSTFRPQVQIYVHKLVFVCLFVFYRSEKNRKEMYLHYIYKLHDLHIPAAGYMEAAF